MSITGIPGLTSKQKAAETVMEYVGQMKAEGIVVDPEGNGVGGVRVFAVASWYTKWRDISTGIKAETVSGPDGTFEFESLPKPIPTWRYDFVAYEPDRYLGWTSGEGRLTYHGSWHSPEPDAYKILVSKPSVRDGRVVDEDGRGIAGATVRPFYGSRAKLLMAVITIDPAVTDEQGYYRLAGIPEKATIRPYVTCPGYASTISNTQELIVMEPGGSLSGRVLDEYDRPFQGVSVYAVPHCGAMDDIKSEADGGYIISGLPLGEITVGVESDEGANSSVQSAVTWAGVTSIVPDLVCPRDVRIKGRVLDQETGQPVPGVRAHVSTIDLGGPAWSSYSKPTDAEGRYELIAMPGNAEILGKGCVDIPAAGIDDLVIWHTAPDLARGRAVDLEGRPMAEVIVQAFVGERYSEQVLTGEDGEFEIEIPEKGDRGFG